MATNIARLRGGAAGLCLALALTPAVSSLRVQDGSADRLLAKSSSAAVHATGGIEFLAAAAAVSALSAAVSTVADASTAGLIGEAESKVLAVEQEIFALRSSSCVAARQLHFRSTSASLALPAALQVGLRPLAGANASEEAALRELSSKLIESLHASAADSDRLVHASCHELTAEDMVLAQTRSELKDASVLVHGRIMIDIGNAIQALFISLPIIGHPGQTVQGAQLLYGQSGLALVSVYESVQTTFSIVRTIRNVPWRTLLHSATSLIEVAVHFALALLVRAPAFLQVSFGLTLQLAGILQSVHLMATTSAEHRSAAELFYDVLVLMRDTATEINMVFNTAELSGWIAGFSSPVTAAFIQVQFCFLAVSQVVGAVIATQLHSKIQAVVLKAEDSVAGIDAFRADFRERQCAFVAQARTSAESQFAMVQTLEMLTRQRRAPSQDLGAGAVGGRIEEILSPFCDVYAAYCAELLSSQPLLRLSRRGFAEEVSEKAARRPVTDIAVVATAAQELALMTLGFRPAGRLGIQAQGARLMACRGCSKSVVVAVREGLPDARGASSEETLALLAPGGLAYAVTRLPSLLESGGGEVLVDIRAFAYALGDASLRSTFDDGVQAALAAERPRLRQEVLTMRTRDTDQSVLWSMAQTIAEAFGISGLGNSYFFVPQHELTVVVATYANRSTLEEANNVQGLQGDFAYVTITHGWECSLHQSWFDGWEDLPLGQDEWAMGRQPVEFLSNVWLHRKTQTPAFMANPLLPDVPASILTLRTALRQSLRRFLLPATLFALGQPLSMNRAPRRVDPLLRLAWTQEALVDSGRENRSGCQVQETFRLPAGVWSAVVRPAASGPPRDGSSNWALARSLSVAVADDFGYFPTAKSMNIWYRKASPNDHHELLQPGSESLKAHLDELDDLTRRLGCKSPVTRTVRL